MSGLDGLGGAPFDFNAKAVKPKTNEMVDHLLQEMVEAAVPFLSTEQFSQQQTEKINQHISAVIDEAVAVMRSTGVHQALSFVEQVFEHPNLIAPQRMEVAEHVLLPRAETFLRMKDNNPHVATKLVALLGASVERDSWGAKDPYTVQVAHVMNAMLDRFDNGLKPKAP